MRYTGLPSKSDVFVYAPRNPRIFKLKGSGRMLQAFSVVLLLAAAWEIRAALLSARGIRLPSNQPVPPQG